jgi:NTP pyrophosphatase (non-canonical NTP hydrolase)
MSEEPLHETPQRFGSSSHTHSAAKWMTSIKGFQTMMKRIYFKRDSARGPIATYDWLIEEVCELGEAMRDSNKRELEEELADVTAWLASLANVLGIDLEQAACGKYSNKCPKCSSSPCNCKS